jgi:hypothetical protein
MGLVALGLVALGFPPLCGAGGAGEADLGAFFFGDLLLFDAVGDLLLFDAVGDLLLFDAVGDLRFGERDLLLRPPCILGRVVSAVSTSWSVLLNISKIFASFFSAEEPPR